MEVLELFTMDGREVAVKRLYEQNCKRMEQFLNEVEILTRLGHINLVTLYGCSSRCSPELLVYEYIPNGTLADHLYGDRAKDRSLTLLLRLFKNVNGCVSDSSKVVHLK